MFKTALNYTGPLIFLKRKPFSIFGREPKQYDGLWSLNVGSKEMCLDLDALGIKSGKSTDCGFPSFLRDDLIMPFLRGVFEGDGCFSLYKRKNGKTDFTMNVICSDAFVDKMNQILAEHSIKFTKTDQIFKNGCACFRANGTSNGLRFMNLLYSNHKGLFLDRKYQKLKDLVEYKETLNTNA